MAWILPLNTFMQLVIFNKTLKNRDFLTWCACFSLAPFGAVSRLPPAGAQKGFMRLQESSNFNKKILL
jgi:hypothetical protein